MVIVRLFRARWPISARLADISSVAAAVWNDFSRTETEARATLPTVSLMKAVARPVSEAVETNCSTAPLIVSSRRPMRLLSVAAVSSSAMLRRRASSASLS